MEQRILKLLEIVREKDMELRALRIGLRTYLEDLTAFKYGRIAGQIVLFEGATYELVYTRALQAADPYDGTSFNFSDEGVDLSQGANNKIWFVSVLFPLTPSGKIKQDTKTVAARREVATYSTSALLSSYSSRDIDLVAFRHASTYLFTLADGTKQEPASYRSGFGMSTIR